MARGDFDDDCPARQVILFLSDRWVPPLMYHLGGQARRPSELLRLMPKISQKMLTQSLRNMESWGLVNRTDHEVVPPNVEYSLTPSGSRFNECLYLLCGWATANEDLVEELGEARRGSV